MDDIYSFFFFFLDWDDTDFLVAHHLQNYHYAFKKHKMSVENVFLVFFKKGLAYLQYFLKKESFFFCFNEWLSCHPLTNKRREIKIHHHLPLYI